MTLWIGSSMVCISARSGNTTRGPHNSTSNGAGSSFTGEGRGTRLQATSVSTKQQSPTLSTVLRPRLAARAIALELRRQEWGSDFTGYTENHTFTELVRLIEDIGGSHWQLSRVPLSRIRCWNTRTPVASLLTVITGEGHGGLHLQKVKRLAAEIQHGRPLPGIVVTAHSRKAGEHWILSGYRRLAAHRFAKAAMILVYHPAGLFVDHPKPPSSMGWWKGSLCPSARTSRRLC